jgi:hypothetical protein
MNTAAENFGAWDQQVDLDLASPGSVTHGYCTGQVPGQSVFYEGHFWKGVRIGPWCYRNADGSLLHQIYYRPARFTPRVFLSRIISSLFYAPEIHGTRTESAILLPIYGVGLVFRAFSTLLVGVTSAWWRIFARSPMIGIIMLVLMAGAGEYGYRSLYRAFHSSAKTPDRAHLRTAVVR